MRSYGYARGNQVIYLKPFRPTFLLNLPVCNGLYETTNKEQLIQERTQWYKDDLTQEGTQGDRNVPKRSINSIKASIENWFPRLLCLKKRVHQTDVNNYSCYVVSLQTKRKRTKEERIERER